MEKRNRKEKKNGICLCVYNSVSERMKGKRKEETRQDEKSNKKKRNKPENSNQYF